MPTSDKYVRDYSQEYRTAKKRNEVGTGSDSGSAKRHKLRREALRLGLVKPGQDLDHKQPLSKGGSNNIANAKATTPAKNRSFPRNKDGSIR